MHVKNKSRSAVPTFGYSGMLESNIMLAPDQVMHHSVEKAAKIKDIGDGL